MRNADCRLQSVMAANLSRKLKTGPATTQEEWTVREKLILSSSVVRSGDQNWVSVSRTVKPIAESGFGVRQHPSDFFSQKSCAAQYSEMLEKVSTPKRKRSNEPGGTETPGERIVRSLTFERIDELKKMIKNDQLKYRKLKSEIDMIMSGKCDEHLPNILEGLQRSKSTETPGFVNQRDLKAPQMTQPAAPTSSLVASAQQPLKSPVPSPKHKNHRVPKPTERFKEFQQEQQARHSHSSPSQTPPPQQQQQQHYQHQQLKQFQQQTMELQHLKQQQLQQQQREQQQQQQREQQKQMHMGQQLNKTSPKTQEQAAKPSHSPSRSFFRAQNQPQVQVLQQQKQHQTQQQTYTNIPSSGPAYLAQLFQDRSNDHSVKQENAAMDVDLHFGKQTKISPKAKESSTSLDIIVDKVNMNHGALLPLSSHLPTAASGLLSTLLSAPVKKMKHVAESMNQSSLSQDQSDNLQRDQSSEPGVPFLDAANTVTDIPKMESVRDKKTGSTLSASEVAPTLSKLLTTTAVGNAKASSHSETFSVQKKESTLLQHCGQDVFEEDCSTKNNITSPVSKSVKEEMSRNRKSFEESRPRENSEKELGSNTLIITKVLVHADDNGKPKPEKRKPGRPRTRKPPKEPEYMGDDTEEEISKELVKPDFTIKIEPDLEEGDGEESFKKIDDLEDLKKEERSDPSVQGSFGSESFPDSPASQISLSGSDDLESLQAQKNWKKSIMLVWRAAANHKYANVFLHPVTDDEAPGYHNVIFRPMDLSAIKKNIESGAIRTTSGFQRDMMLMFQNALMYNSSDHDVYRMAEEMREDVMDQITSYIATQLMVQSDRESKMLRGHKADGYMDDASTARSKRDT